MKVSECLGQEFGCKKYPDCNKYCKGYIQLKNIYYFSNLPNRYRGNIQLKATKEDLELYKFLNDWKTNIKENVNNGKGLFLCSETKGNGKTSWACKILNEYLKNVCLTNNLRCRGIFVNVPDFLQDIRNEISTDDNEMQAFINYIKEADIVVWDDIGVEKPSDWVREQLYILINYRESNGLSQVYTSNLKLDVLKSDRYLGGRIVSRISGQCDICHFTGNDRREYK